MLDNQHNMYSRVRYKSHRAALTSGVLPSARTRTQEGSIMTTHIVASAPARKPGLCYIANKTYTAGSINANVLH